MRPDHVERFKHRKRTYSASIEKTEKKSSGYKIFKILNHLKKVKTTISTCREHDGKEELPDEFDQFLKDNPLDGVFDLDEHPEVKFRSYFNWLDN